MSHETVTQHVTIGDLRSQGRLLEVGCDVCSHHLYLDPNTLPFADEQSVPLAFKRMKCSKCGTKLWDRMRPGQRAGYTRPDARIVGVTG